MVEQQELPFASSDMRSTLESMVEFLHLLEEKVPQKPENPCGCVPARLGGVDVAELARTALAAHEVVGAARDLEDALKVAIADAMPTKQLVLEDGISVERKAGTVRKNWDHPLVASIVAERATVDVETGEKLMTAEQAQRVADELLATAGISYWRAGALRERGLNPDTYCSTERGRMTVVIRTPS